MKDNLYSRNLYRATLSRVVDGDTVDVEIDMGFTLRGRFRIRLDNINTPETYGEERKLGEVASEHVARTLTRVGSFIVRARKVDSFGRWLAEIFFEDYGHPDGLRSFNQQLVAQGYAVTWDGRGKRPSFDPEAPFPIPQPEDAPS